MQYFHIFRWTNRWEASQKWPLTPNWKDFDNGIELESRWHWRIQVQIVRSWSISISYYLHIDLTLKIWSSKKQKVDKSAWFASQKGRGPTGWTFEDRAGGWMFWGNAEIASSNSCWERIGDLWLLLHSFACFVMNETSRPNTNWNCLFNVCCRRLLLKLLKVVFTLPEALYDSWN